MASLCQGFGLRHSCVILPSSFVISSQVDQLQLARHLRRDPFLMIIRPGNWRDIRRNEADGGGNKIVVTENAVGRIEANPARAREKNFGPGMEGTFGAPGFGLAFAQITTR